MARPCNCERESCRLCWLWYNDPRYTTLWSKTEYLPPPVGQKSSPITTEEAIDLFGSDAEDPTLLGNRIAALTEAIGIPPCSGCSKRKEWLNRAHAWLRSLLEP
jgi:hypothetical protein